MEESKWEKVGGGKEVLSPSLPNPAPSPLFLAHFSFRFPNYLVGLLQVNYKHSLHSNFFYNLSVEHF